MLDIKANQPSKQKKRNFTHLLKNDIDLDITLIGIGILILLTSYLVYQKVYVSLSVVAVGLITLTLYVWKRKAILFSNNYEENNDKESRNAQYVYAGLSAVFIGLDILVLYGSSDALFRSLYIFLIPLVQFCVLFCELIITKKNNIKGVSCFLLFQLIVLFTTIMFSSLFVFPYNGGDTWAHIYSAEQILQNESFKHLAGLYGSYPLFPALVYVFAVISGINIPMTIRLIIALLSILCLLQIFTLGKYTYKSSFRGVLLVLILAGSKWYIYWSNLAVSMITAMFCFCTFTLVLNLHLFEKPESKKIIFLSVIAAITPFFHPVGAFAVVLLCFAYWLVGKIFYKEDEGIKNNFLLTLLLFVGIVTLTQWIYYGSTFDSIAPHLLRAIFSDLVGLAPEDNGGLGGGSIGTSLDSPGIYALSNLNFFVLLGLAGIEVLRQIKLRQDKLSLYSGFSGFIFVFFAYGTQFVNLQDVLPYRWFLFGTILLSIPASATLLLVIRVKSPWKLGAILTCSAIFFFLGFANKDVNRDHPFYGSKTAEIYELTSSEYNGLQFSLTDPFIRKSNLQVDFRMLDFLKYYDHRDATSYWVYFYPQEFDGVFSLRDKYFERTGLIRNLDRDFVFHSPYLNQFYDSGDFKWLDSLSENKPEP